MVSDYCKVLFLNEICDGKVTLNTCFKSLLQGGIPRPHSYEVQYRILTKILVRLHCDWVFALTSSSSQQFHRKGSRWGVCSEHQAHRDLICAYQALWAMHNRSVGNFRQKRSSPEHFGNSHSVLTDTGGRWATNELRMYGSSSDWKHLIPCTRRLNYAALRSLSWVHCY